MKEQTYTTFQVADICNVQPSSVIKWAKQNKIRAFTTPGGHRRIRYSDLLDFMNQYGFPIPDELGGERKKILIIEDDSSIAKMLQKTLQNTSSEFDIEIKEDGLEALLCLGSQKPHLIVLDVVMPLIDGARVLSTLKADPSTKNIPVIAITGKRLPPEKLKFMQLNTNAFYLKPFDVEEVAKKIATLLHIKENKLTLIPQNK